ncbi:PREDICTED: peptidyl-prolyl cis-trans isomerase FKBP4-like [Branchiostoma belcheri]|uniref:peptidylprolyl isomerase n=1 Tax=Branchiostoma belcheri TaxID=7741 RepID=A0A6P4YAK1_BRABE|nr:PREDICTED: peptidyl-prolyl cis-trans isomerase FKBP4-like [Branchiostoma belcheri]KAI8494994.1 Peptidyl-prolyl cis-trans isomerase fkbp4 [Branchiostoma belcheri]
MAENSSDQAATSVTSTGGDDITPNKDGGVLKKILRQGEGEDRPLAEDKVSVHYVGTLTDGTKFDSSRDRDDKFEFTLGKGQVIKGWDLGVATMKRGELAQLTCRPQYAYGKRGSPPKIPEDATLIFEVELLDFFGEDISEEKEGGIVRRVIKKGVGYDRPKEGAIAEIHLLGTYNGLVFEDRDVQYIVGETATDHGVVEGVDYAVTKMKAEEKWRVQLKSQFAFGNEGKKDFNIPARAQVEYEVELKNFEKVKESWQMDTREKLEASDKVKAKGTTFFKGGKYKEAVTQYKKILDYLEFDADRIEDEEDKKSAGQLMLAAHLNLAMCYLKTDEPYEVINHCSKALEKDPNNEKAFFRRGQARFTIRDYEEARSDFNAVLKIDPNNKAAKNQVTTILHHQKKEREQEKKLYGSMFEKMAAQGCEVDSRGKHGGDSNKLEGREMDGADKDITMKNDKDSAAGEP